MLILLFLFVIITLVFIGYGFLPSYINKKVFFAKKKTDEKVIYLTFDDGPSEYTADLLKVLNYYNVKATFFCVADFAKVQKSTIVEMKSHGHLVALHSLKHKNAMLQGFCETKADLAKSLIIMKSLGVEIKYYRPPWGDVNLCLLRELKKKNINLILWNVMAEDWKADTTEGIIVNKLLSRVHNGDIICLHDGRGKNEAPLRTISALKTAIPIFLEKGYVFKTIDEYEV